MTAWGRFVTACSRQEDDRALQAVRIAVCCVVALDLLRVAQLGLVAQLFVPYEAGGMVGESHWAWVFDRVLPPAVAGPTLWATTLGCMVLGALGIAARPALVVGALAYAQLGHLDPGADLGIDRLLRTVMLLLAVGGPPALSPWRAFQGGAARLTRAWPRLVLLWVLVLVYLSAGTAKLVNQPAWVVPHGRPVLYRILADPLAGRLDAVAVQGWDWLFTLLGQGTIALELSAPLLLTRFAPRWAVGAVVMHLGIAGLMHLGMFSWGMLALYPAVYAGPVIDWLARRRRGLG